MTTNRHTSPAYPNASAAMPRLLPLRDVTAATALSRSSVYALMASPASRSRPASAPGRPLGRAGSARLHRQPSPGWLGSVPRVA